MQLRIVHTTGFEYDGQVAASFNEARLTPQTRPGQLVAHSRLEVQPSPWTDTYRDYWGTEVTSFEVLDPHSSLTVTSTATVHTDREGAAEPQLSWAEVRASKVADEFDEFLELSPRVAPTDDLAALVDEIGERCPTPGAAARELCTLVHDQVVYASGSTDVAGYAAEAWRERHGVCQDMAHLVIGALRRLGVPTRYVSGYLHPDPDAPLEQTVTGESHAWVQWWDGEWCGFDPTNDQNEGDRHVVVATGRDYEDVKPLSGIFTGGSTSRMFVDVQITRLA